jgi:hypothetical protein
MSSGRNPARELKRIPGKSWVKLNSVNVREAINMPKDKIVVNVKIGGAPSATACKVLDHTCITGSEN